MVDLAKVFFANPPDGEYLATCLAKIPYDSPSDWRADTLAKVRSGEFSAVEVAQHGRRCGVLVYAVYDHGAMRELFVNCCYAVLDDGSSVLSDALDSLARHYACDEIRFHTSRVGAVSKALKNGYRIAEIVMRKRISHEQRQ